jgi:predicted N-formylglutamate amidohydrolase
MLDACFIEQHYSRLVVDCNRHATASDVMAAVSDGTMVPGNRDLSPDDRAARLDEIYEPYHRAIADALVTRERAGQATVLVALHSFTPSLKGGAARPWDIGVLYGGGEVGFALALLAALSARGGLCVGDNEPYQMDETDYTVPRHAWAMGLAYVELEVNQRRLGDDGGVADMADVLAAAMGEAMAAVGV